MIEQPVVFKSHGNWLTGIVHHAAAEPDPHLEQGVIIVVGGPQTRVGSHRQFVLLARFLAKQGINVFRFDYTGIGDSDGANNDFLTASQDLTAAIEQFKHQCSELKRIALWGLCDAASVILLYLSQQQSALINDIFIANPWVEQPRSKAKTMLKHYYFERLLSGAFWRKIISGRFNLTAAITGVLAAVKGLYSPRTAISQASNKAVAPEFNQDNFVDYMRQGLAKFDGQVHLILSGQDLVAKEFSQLLIDDKQWSQLKSQKITSQLVLKSSSHTFSSVDWRRKVEHFTINSLIQEKRMG
jgi:exosortase A-associated hydrolase 1